MEVIKVSGHTRPRAIAGALAVALKENNSAEIHAVGANAVNQTVKAIAITRDFVAPDGMDLVAIPSFIIVNINGEDRTAIKFIVESR